MRRFLFILSTIGLFVCIAITIFAFTNLYIITNFFIIFFLGILVFVVMGPVTFRLKKLNGQRRKLKRGVKQVISETNQTSNKFFKAHWKRYPIYLKTIFIIIVVYGFTNFFVMLSFSEEGEPKIKNDQYILVHKGDTVKELTKKEYLQLKGYTARLFSGHLAIFFSFGMLFNYKGKNGA